MLPNVHFTPCEKKTRSERKEEPIQENKDGSVQAAEEFTLCGTLHPT